MPTVLRLVALLGLLAAWPAAAQPGAGPTHTLRTLAGTSPNGSPGSVDGPALQARFNWPRGLAQAADGTLYVADTFSGTIRKISPAGVGSTLAGKAPAASAATTGQVPLRSSSILVPWPWMRPATCT